MVWTGFIWLVEQSVVLRLVRKCKVLTKCSEMRWEICSSHNEELCDLYRSQHGQGSEICEVKIDRIYNYNANTRNVKALLVGE
jgi:hypothetical protein